MSTISVEDRSRRWARHGAGHRLLLAMATAAVLTAVAPLQTAGVPWLARAVEFTTAALVWEVAMVAARTVLLRTALVDRPTTVSGLVVVVVAASLPATATIALFLTASGERIGPFYAGSLLLGLLVAFGISALWTPALHLDVEMVVRVP